MKPTIFLVMLALVIAPLASASTVVESSAEATCTSTLDTNCSVFHANKQITCPGALNVTCAAVTAFCHAMLGTCPVE